MKRKSFTFKQETFSKEYIDCYGSVLIEPLYFPFRDRLDRFG